MDDRAFTVLEFDQVLAACGSLAQTDLGRARVLALRPIPEPTVLDEEQARVAEMALFDQVEGGLTLGDLFDLRPLGHGLATPGTHLDPEELDIVGRTLACLSQARRLLLGRAQSYPRLAQVAGRLLDRGSLAQEIQRTFGPGLTMADSASPALARLRQRTAGLKEDLRRELENMLVQGRGQGIFQDDLITQRGERFVLPVKAGRQSDAPGIIHDASASGQTVFVEPLAVVGLNNQLGLLSAAERAEVIRVLTRLTDQLREIWPSLLEDLALGAELDCLQARARLGRRLKAVRPEFGPDDLVDLRQARHPLLILAGVRVVPVDLRFPLEKSILVISGPNAGGKTVALKTLGLLSLMALSGLAIPAGEGSRLPRWGSVAASIGDDQDLADGASTFSARLRWFKAALDQAGPGSLVLVDELGGGTDPAEGAALGLAFLDRLAQAGAKVLATTHLNFIKAYAAANPLAENLAVQFDPGSKRPTYELVYGRPGLSNAFEAAGQVGLPPELTERARAYLGGGEERFAGLLGQLSELVQAHRATLARLAEDEAGLAREKGRLEALAQDLERRRQELVVREGAKLQDLIGRAEAELSAALDQAKAQEAKARERARYQFYQAKAGLSRALGKIKRGTEAERDRPESREGALPPGARVKVAGFQRPGVVEKELKEGKLVEVRLAGGLKVQVAPAELSALTEPEPRPPRQAQVHYAEPDPAQAPAWPEVNIIGKRVEEALPLVDKALDEAILAGLPRLAVVHGVGTGVLRQAVREFLVGHPQVKRFGAAQGRRGAAVTEIELGL